MATKLNGDEQVSIATTSLRGVVKPDGTSITVASDGTLSSASGGGVARGALNSNVNGDWWVWGDGVIEMWGSVTVSPTGSHTASVGITFPTSFTTSVGLLQLTVAGFPRFSSSDQATATATTISTSGALVSLQCNVPTGGGGATVDQPVPVFWYARGI